LEYIPKHNKLRKTTSSEIERVKGSLKSSKTQRYDNISNNILKACKIFITVPVSYLCNLVLFEGIFPERLKYATIVLVYKKGDKNIVTNYRPISILTSFNKIFEKIMYCRLLKHLSDSSILRNHQFGFIINQGTDNAVFKLIFGILNSLSQKILVGGVFCDLEKAFDCVSHEVLLNKLRYYGIEYKQYNLYKSFLQDGFQRTTICSGLNNSNVYS
jgi:hypothetical protein